MPRTGNGAGPNLRWKTPVGRCRVACRHHAGLLPSAGVIAGKIKVTGSNLKGNGTCTTGRTRQFHLGPLDLRIEPVKLPGSTYNAGPGQTLWQALSIGRVPTGMSVFDANSVASRSSIRLRPLGSDIRWLALETSICTRDQKISRDTWAASCDESLTGGGSSVGRARALP
jgi:hypothetical protein